MFQTQNGDNPSELLRMRGSKEYFLTCSIWHVEILFFFLNSLLRICFSSILERARGREKHPSVAAHMCPTRESKAPPLWDDTQPTGPHLPGLAFWNSYKHGTDVRVTVGFQSPQMHITEHCSPAGVWGDLRALTGRWPGAASGVLMAAMKVSVLVPNPAPRHFTASWTS